MNRRRPAPFLALLVCLGLGTAVAGAPPVSASVPSGPGVASSSGAVPAGDRVVRSLDRAAHPLRTVEPGGDTRDLRPLGDMTGDARVVGLGEATHSSYDFFTMKHRVFRHLVEHEGFRTFALEGSWSTGLRLDEYVLHGKGDPRRIMSDEFQADYRLWNTEEYLRLVEWMRAYNRDHPGDPVRFMGDDFGWAGPELYDRVTGYVARAHPALLPRITGLYRGLRPTAATGAHMERYMNRPLAERKEAAARTGEALKLLRQRVPGADRDAYDWAVQHATAIDQTARGYAADFEDPAQLADVMRYRDRIMADNVAWWERHTGTKVLLSAHNAHVGYETGEPERYPRMQGAFLRDRYGSAYVSVGFTFDHGSFNATGPDGRLRRFTVGPASAGSNERVLDRVAHRDYVVDLRTVASPARAWLERTRPTRGIGTEYPFPDQDIALARSHDVLIHLHGISAARLRAR
ncbi:hypothetical protein GCM10010145_32490 [Streptomyces ruber]|uniref:Erythromycin esterase n=2 Tax=Streptomyces TaxID=1883 RepID=A0A918ESS0_9ACTN|nr:erythromycin esterase family protein [Streptomyces ruber]GGQ59892.1 hypothetical protein GCM10010145_32490 [Streptomyces ruber]